MWFDAQAALAEIEGGALPPSDPATGFGESVRPAEPDAVFPFPKPEPRLARLARLARPPARNPETVPEADAGAETLAHGTAFDGSPRTWTGRLVSLAAWRDLTEWERHGPNGRHWNGLTRQWEAAQSQGSDPAVAFWEIK